MLPFHLLTNIQCMELLTFIFFGFNYFFELDSRWHTDNFFQNQKKWFMLNMPIVEHKPKSWIEKRREKKCQLQEHMEMLEQEKI